MTARRPEEIEENIRILYPFILDYIKIQPRRVKNIVEHILSRNDIGLDLSEDDVKKVMNFLNERRMISFHDIRGWGTVLHRDIEEVALIHVQHDLVDTEGLIRIIKKKYCPDHITEEEAELMIHTMIERHRIKVGLNEILFFG